MAETELIKYSKTPDISAVQSSKDDNSQLLSKSVDRGADAQKQIEQLDTEIKSKQRLLIGLNRSLKPVDKRLADEIYNRDQFIDELNKKLMEISSSALETKLKRIKQQDQQLDTLEEQNQRLLQDKMQLSDQLAQKDIEISNNELEFDKERQDIEAAQEELRLQINEQELQKDARTVETKEVKEDLVQLAQIVQNMTGINKDLNEKITQLNSAMEESNNRVFSADVQASSAEQLEAKLAEQINLASETQRKLNKAERTANRLKLEKQTLIDWYQENSEKMKNLEGILFGSVMEEYKVVSEQLTTIRHDFKMKFESLPQEDELPFEHMAGPEEILVAQREEINQKELELGQIRKKDKILQNRIKQLTDGAAMHAEKVAEVEARANARSDILDEYVITLKYKLQKANAKLNKKSMEMTRVQASLNTYIARKDNKKSQRNSQTDILKKLQSEVSNYKQKIVQMATTMRTREREVWQRENRIRKIVSTLKSYEDELFRRDTNLIQKTGQLNKMKEENEELRSKMGITMQNQSTSRILDQSETDIQQQKHNDSQQRASPEPLFNSRLKPRHPESLRVQKALNVSRTNRMNKSSSTRVTASMPRLNIKKSKSVIREQLKDPIPLYQLINNFVHRVQEIRSWQNQQAQRLKKYKKSMKNADLRLLLDADIPGRDDMLPLDALEKVYTQRLTALKKDIIGNLKGIKQKINVPELLTNVRSEDFAQLLGDRSEVTIADLGMAIQDIV